MAHSTSKHSPEIRSRLAAGAKPTIAVCVLIIDTLHHEAVWREWSSQQSDFAVRFFIHAKFPDRVRSPWVRAATSDRSFAPEWNSPEVVRAMLMLLDWALQDDSCERFVFATESCVPVWSLQETGRRLMAEDVSWLRARNSAETRWERACCFESVDFSKIPRSVSAD